jgi:signal peptidase II
MTSKKFLLVFGMAAVLIGLDQWTKFAAIGHLTENRNVHVIPGFFDLTLRFNTGAAFSLFTSKPSAFFLAVSSVAVAVLLYFVHETEWTEKKALVSLGAILGGAMGNLVDRLIRGSVVDFLLFYVRSFSWPAFNAADVFIVVGVFGYLWYNLRQGEAAKKKVH